MTALAIAIFFALLTFTVPVSLSLNARDGYLVPWVFSVLFAFFLSFNNSRGHFLSLSSMLILFALPLSALWTTGLSNEFIIGGLIPFSDAAGYYNDANRFLEGGVFSEFSTRRPLFPGLLAVMLWMSAGNLRWALAILVLITALAVYLATLQVRKRTGAAPAALFMLICFLFYRRFIGTTLTEHLGLTLGVLGFALLWLSAVEKKVTAAFCGVALLTLALNARAGAFFVLPMLILWIVIYFRDDTFPSYRIFLVASACVLLGFAINYLLVSVVGDPHGGAFSNFAYVLYGLVFGGDWRTAINIPPPETIGLSGKALTDKLYQLTITAVIHDPSLLISGMLRAWKVYILKGYAFSFVITDPGNPEIKKLFYPQLFSNFRALTQYAAALLHIATFYVLSFVGVYWAYRNRAREGAVIMAFLGGILLSIPFVPPWDSDTGRVYAATVPVLAMIPSYGISNSVLRFKQKGTLQKNESDENAQKSGINSIVIYTLTIFLSLVFVGGLTIIKHTRADAAMSIMECADGKEQLFLKLGSGSYLTFTDDAGRDTAIPRVQVKDFRRNLDRLSYLYPETAGTLDKLAANQNLFLLDKGYAVVDAMFIPDNVATIQLCAKKKQVTFMNFYYVN